MTTCPYCHKSFIEPAKSLNTIISQFVMVDLYKVMDKDLNITAKLLVDYFLEIEPERIYEQANKMITRGFWVRVGRGKYRLAHDFNERKMVHFRINVKKKLDILP